MMCFITELLLFQNGTALLETRLMLYKCLWDGGDDVYLYENIKNTFGLGTCLVENNLLWLCCISTVYLILFSDVEFFYL